MPWLIAAQQPAHREQQDHHDGTQTTPARTTGFLLGGGGILYNGEARVYLRDVRLAQDRNVPTFAYAMGVGPLDEAEDRDLVRTTLERMAGVTVRDELSRRVLEHVGLERRVDVTADPALLLEPDAFPPERLVHKSVTEGRPAPRGKPRRVS